MEIVKGVNTALSFVLEIAMLIAFGYWGFSVEGNGLVRWGLAIGLPVVTVLIWGLYFAPKAKRRLSIWPGALLSLGLFLLAAGALYQAQQPLTGAALALGALVNRILVLTWQQW